MALILGLHEGDSFYIGDLRVVVDEIIAPEKYKIRVCDTIEKVMTVQANNRVEIIPDVFVSAGKSDNRWEVRAALEAPKNIKILRGKLYEQGKD